MVDTTDSKSVAREGVRVQVSSPVVEPQEILRFFLFLYDELKNKNLNTKLSCVRI